MSETRASHEGSTSKTHQESQPRMSETKAVEAVRRPRGVKIDERAVVSARAKLGEGVEIGPWAWVGDDVELGDGCRVMPHAFLQGPARIGRENVFHPFCSVGSDPQDLKFEGERTDVVIGDANQFREYVTVNRGTKKGISTTRIGSHNLFMTQSHIAHDSIVGNHTIFANGATLAGHVEVHDHATVGAFSPVHQFCRIGRHAYIGACTVITQDVLPFSMVVTKRETHLYGANKVGLGRRGFSEQRIRDIERAFRLLLRSKLNTTQAVERMRETLGGSDDVKEMITFIESVARGLTK
jgi:UDP-N-acetylglucosamine acyltransferase